jgi:hypothetical protein
MIDLQQMYSNLDNWEKTRDKFFDGLELKDYSNYELLQNVLDNKNLSIEEKVIISNYCGRNFENGLDMSDEWMQDLLKKRSKK